MNIDNLVNKISIAYPDEGPYDPVLTMLNSYAYRRKQAEKVQIDRGLLQDSFKIVKAISNNVHTRYYLTFTTIIDKERNMSILGYPDDEYIRPMCGLVELGILHSTNIYGIGVPGKLRLDAKDGIYSVWYDEDRNIHIDRNLHTTDANSTGRVPYELSIGEVLDYVTDPNIYDPKFAYIPENYKLIIERTQIAKQYFVATMQINDYCRALLKWAERTFS